MVGGEVAAIRFFHKHVVSIMKVVLLDGTSNGGEGGGDTVLPRARCEYHDGCCQTGQRMVGKVAAMLLFFKHVVGIVMVAVRRDKQWW